MTPHQIVVIGLRLTAVLWLLYLTGQIPMIFAQSIVSADGFNLPFVVAFGVFNLAICAILWIFPASIAKKLLPSPSNDVVYENPPGSIEWLTLGSILIGLWALSGAVSDAIYWSLSVALNPERMAIGLDAEGKAAIFATIFELAIGAWLILGARGIGVLLWKIRTGGVTKS